MIKKWLVLAVFIVPAGIFCVSAQADADESGKIRETFRGNAVVRGAIAPGSASMVQITITRWSTDEQRQQLLSTLVEKGQEELVKELTNQEECGFIRLPNTLGYRIHYARDIRDGNQRRIILATDRPIAFGELWRNSRTLDYTVTLVELRLDEKNEGDGTIALAVKLKANHETKTLELENYDTAPISMMRVRKTD